MKIKLTVKDRIQLLSLLPSQGGMIEMGLAKGIIETTKFTPDEVKEYELRDFPGGRVGWNPAKIKEVEYNFKDAEIQCIQSGIKEKDAKKLITSDNYDLALRFQNIKTK